MHNLKALFIALIRSRILLPGLAVLGVLLLALAFMLKGDDARQIGASARPSDAAGSDSPIGIDDARDGSENVAGEVRDEKVGMVGGASGEKRVRTEGVEAVGAGNNGEKPGASLTTERARSKDIPAASEITAPKIIPLNPKLDVSRGPIPGSPPSTWFGLADVPARMRDAGLQTTIAYTLSIGPEGRVLGCQASETNSNGLAALFCSKVRSRASFDPATDKDGMPVPGVYKSGLKLNIAASRASSKPSCQSDVFSALAKGC